MFSIKTGLAIAGTVAFVAAPPLTVFLLSDGDGDGPKRPEPDPAPSGDRHGAASDAAKSAVDSLTRQSMGLGY